ncbi:MAG: LLM class flavin-dependent oxidoreductase [Acidimicrobiia bacterium]
MGDFPAALSVLDLAPVGEGYTSSDALRSSVQLARHAEALGYTRYWVAEHHGMPGIASSSPAVLVSSLAANTSTIRVGSGGVMLPNHAPLVVAEQFGMLEALYPGRIDLGIGRAPGTDPVTARALRRTTAPLSADDFPVELSELLGFFSGAFPEGHPYRDVRAVPGRGDTPAVWLLGSTDYSAQVAGLLGLPFSFAYHFAAANLMPAVVAYRRRFEPSETLEKPYLAVGITVVCAETEAEARYQAGPGVLSFLRVRSGRAGKCPTPQEAAEYNYTPSERLIVHELQSAQVVGTPDTVRRRLLGLVERCGADEFVVSNVVHGHEDRARSYRLLAEAVGLRPPPATALNSGTAPNR